MGYTIMPEETPPAQETTPAVQPSPVPEVSSAPIPEAPVADLLDFDTAPPKPTLQLSQNVSMTGDNYQSLWGANADAASMVIPLKTQPASTSDVEIALASHRIYTMASGELPTEYKFFLYCQEEDTQKFILIQVAMRKTPLELDLVFKTT